MVRHEQRYDTLFFSLSTKKYDGKVQKKKDNRDKISHYKGTEEEVEEERGFLREISIII